MNSEMSEMKRTTFGLRLDQLADIFGVAVENHVSTENDCASDKLSGTLRRRLTEVMPGNSLLLTAVSRIAASNLTEMVGKSLLQALSNPESTVDQLQVLKEASKSLSNTGVSDQERAVATTIYHAAIASCLVHHAKKISQHSYDKLDESFNLLIEKSWMDRELVELFSKARQICQAKRSQ